MQSTKTIELAGVAQDQELLELFENDKEVQNQIAAEKIRANEQLIQELKNEKEALKAELKRREAEELAKTVNTVNGNQGATISNVGTKERTINTSLSHPINTTSNEFAQRRKLDQLCHTINSKEKQLSEYNQELSELASAVAELNNEKEDPSLKKLKQIETCLDDTLLRNTEAANVLRTYKKIAAAMHNESNSHDRQIAELKETIEAKEKMFEKVSAIFVNATNLVSEAENELQQFMIETDKKRTEEIAQLNAKRETVRSFLMKEMNESEETQEIQNINQPGTNINNGSTSIQEPNKLKETLKNEVNAGSNMSYTINTHENIGTKENNQPTTISEKENGLSEQQLMQYFKTDVLPKVSETVDSIQTMVEKARSMQTMHAEMTAQVAECEKKRVELSLLKCELMKQKSDCQFETHGYSVANNSTTSEIDKDQSNSLVSAAEIELREQLKKENEYITKQQKKCTKLRKLVSVASVGLGSILDCLSLLKISTEITELGTKEYTDYAALRRIVLNDIALKGQGNGKKAIKSKDWDNAIQEEEEPIDDSNTIALTPLAKNENDNKNKEDNSMTEKSESNNLNEDNKDNIISDLITNSGYTESNNNNNNISQLENAEVLLTGQMIQNHRPLTDLNYKKLIEQITQVLSQVKSSLNNKYDITENDLNNAIDAVKRIISSCQNKQNIDKTNEVIISEKLAGKIMYYANNAATSVIVPRSKVVGHLLNQPIGDTNIGLLSECGCDTQNSILSTCSEMNGFASTTRSQAISTTNNNIGEIDVDIKTDDNDIFEDDNEDNQNYQAKKNKNKNINGSMNSSKKTTTTSNVSQSQLVAKILNQASLSGSLVSSVRTSRLQSRNTSNATSKRNSRCTTPTKGSNSTDSNSNELKISEAEIAAKIQSLESIINPYIDSTPGTDSERCLVFSLISLLKILSVVKELKKVQISKQANSDQVYSNDDSPIARKDKLQNTAGFDNQQSITLADTNKIENNNEYNFDDNLMMDIQDNEIRNNDNILDDLQPEPVDPAYKIHPGMLIGDDTDDIVNAMMTKREKIGTNNLEKQQNNNNYDDFDNEDDLDSSCDEYLDKRNTEQKFGTIKIPNYLAVENNANNIKIDLPGVTNVSGIGIVTEGRNKSAKKSKWANNTRLKTPTILNRIGAGQSIPESDNAVVIDRATLKRNNETLAKKMAILTKKDDEVALI